MSDSTILSPQEEQGIHDRLDEAHERAAAAAERVGRKPEDVRILLATKTQPAERILVALRHGSTLIGENRVQELTGKAEALAAVAHESHLIGPLQKNKVNHTLRVPSCTCIQSIDDAALARKIHTRLETEASEGVADRTIDVFVQVNTSREDSKSGIVPEAAEELVAAVLDLDRLRLRGFMTIGLPGSSPEEIRPSYRDLVAVKDRLLDSGIITADQTALSMGMSNDYELAIEEGATIIRLGSSIFGARA
ncbi:YggS family pyridoxal phosphate-dependent enzyme [Brevibacterium litoralis]|uniref:YggS family pyridoxal phosphate-dependent enzyme n=1 Tax=Brevibacterium litoralis TaxID=3138935 RepID=UPI0032F083AC